MKNIIITHADRDGLASAAVWLHQHSDIDEVIAIRDPKYLGRTIRSLEPAVSQFCLFDLPFSADAAYALQDRYEHGAEILWIDHHLPAWQEETYPIALSTPQRWKVVLPTGHRTTAVRMTMEWLWMQHEGRIMPYTYLKPLRIPGKYEIPQKMFDYLLEVCGVTDQTDRVYLLDAIEEMVNHGNAPSSEQLKQMLRMSIEGDHALGASELEMAQRIRNRWAEVEAFFSDRGSEAWDVQNGVVYIKDASRPPLKGVPRKNLSMTSQRVTGAQISVIRHRADWAYIGLTNRTSMDLMKVLREIPGLHEGEGMVGHPYVVSMKGFSIDGQDDPVAYIADWLRDRLAVVTEI